MSRALEILFDQVALGKTRQQIAIDIGYSRPSVSRYMSGTYGDGIQKLEAAILKAYDKRDCPHTGEPIASEVCRKKALGPKPFGGSARQIWWLACQNCPHKPTPENAK